MATRILVLGILMAVFSSSADEINYADPNLRPKRDGVMNYEPDAFGGKLGVTSGAIILEEKPLKLPPNKKPAEEEKKEINDGPT